MERLTKNEQGLSLIEVLAGLTILAVALIPIMIMFSTGISSTMRTTYRNLAVSFAQQEMEEIRNLTWNDATDEFTDPPPQFPLDTTVSEEKTSGGKRFTQDVLVERATIEGQARDDIREITVTVSWTISGDTKSVSMVTYRFKGI